MLALELKYNHQMQLMIDLFQKYDVYGLLYKLLNKRTKRWFRCLKMKDL